jgi:hypothetical protein
MGMQEVALNQPSEPVRAFPAQVRNSQGLVIEAEAGRAQYGVNPNVESKPEERKQAWGRIQQLQQKVGQSLAEQGVTEDDVIRAVLEDD